MFSGYGHGRFWHFGVVSKNNYNIWTFKTQTCMDFLNEYSE